MSCEDCDNYKPRPAIKYGNGCANYQPKPPEFTAERITQIPLERRIELEFYVQGTIPGPSLLKEGAMLAEILTAYYGGDRIEIINENPKDGKEYLARAFYRDADKETK